MECTSDDRQRTWTGQTQVLRAVLALATLTGSGASAQNVQAEIEPRTEVYGEGRTTGASVLLRVDLYEPAGLEAKGAVILVHGGGFSRGRRDLEENRDYGEALARRGYVAAAISYRLIADSPVVEGWARRYAAMARNHPDPHLRQARSQLGPPFPDAIAAAGEDLVSAVRWMRARAPELGFDPANIAVFGASAGAITALTAAYAMDEYGGPDLEIGAVIALRGLMLRSAGSERPFPQGGPPLMILHGEADERVPLSEAEELYELARASGVPVELYTAPGMGHELGAGGMLQRRVDRDRTVLDRIDAFLEDAFRGSPASRTLRGRLLPRAEEPPPPDLARAGKDAQGMQAFQSSLARAVDALVASVRADIGSIPELYGISKMAHLTHETDDPARLDWSYWPRARAGLSLRYMDSQQRALTHGILEALLSSRGYLKVNHIMMLEDVLRATEEIGFIRDPEAYVVAVFGIPRVGEIWGLRFEGHHLSLNVTVLPSTVSVTPSFLGASPAPVPGGPRAGFHALRYEQRYAYDLIAALEPWQREAAVISDRPLGDIMTTQFQVDPQEWARWQERLSRDGIAASAFDPRQKELIFRLIREVATTYADEVSTDWLERLDLDSVVFAWMGSTVVGDPHYFRLQGIDFVFELDATQNDGTHVHTVWRDAEHDFGGDPLLQHRATHAHE